MYHQTTVIGYLGGDPEVRYLPSEVKHWAAMDNFGYNRIHVPEQYYRRYDRLLEGGLDAGGVRSVGFEDHVAALQVAGDIDEPERLVECAQGLHLHQMTAADIDAAEQRDVCAHAV